MALQLAELGGERQVGSTTANVMPSRPNTSRPTVTLVRSL